MCNGMRNIFFLIDLLDIPQWLAYCIHWNKKSILKSQKKKKKKKLWYKSNGCSNTYICTTLAYETQSQPARLDTDTTTHTRSWGNINTSFASPTRLLPPGRRRRRRPSRGRSTLGCLRFNSWHQLYFPLQRLPRSLGQALSSRFFFSFPSCYFLTFIFPSRLKLRLASHCSMKYSSQQHLEAPEWWLCWEDALSGACLRTPVFYCFFPLHAMRL